jgi:hypothetical protein
MEKIVEARNRRIPPQQAVDRFWSKFSTKEPARLTTILPQGPEGHIVVDAIKEDIKDSGASIWVSANFEEARQTCKAKFERIVAECRRANEKYRDKSV